MELMNQYYTYEVKENEIQVLSKDSKRHLIAEFNFEAKEGMIAKNMIEGVQYKSFKRWVKGLMSHRAIELSKEMDLSKFN